MSNFYFFTDPTLLDVQVAAQAFGPAGTSAGKDLFRITDAHTSSSANVPAFAICDGVLCAQEDDQGTLTLILKPSQTPPFESPVVSYFVYKGVAKSSLLNLSDGNIIDENASNATDFTRRVVAEWKKQNANDLTNSHAALGLDRDKNFIHHDGANKIKVFTDSDFVERLFTYPHKSVQLPPVAAGEQIGSFQSSFGFEVVLTRLGYKPRLEFARSRDNQISVTSLAADNNGVPWLPDDHAFFKHQHDKEQVLAFMDPCAFFGSFVQAKLYKKSGNNSDRIKGSDIYQDLLQKFANRNTAWLDIRNNHGYSYNLFGLYKDTIRFIAPKNASQTNDKNFRFELWPLLKLQVADVPGFKRRRLHRTKLSLPVGSSTAPAVLISKGFVKSLVPERPKFRTPAIAPDPNDPQFYTPFRVAFPATDDGGQTVFTASYTRVNIYEKPGGSQSAHALKIPVENFLAGVFRFRDLKLDTNYADLNLRLEIYPEEVLVDLEGVSGPTYSASVGIADDGINVTLFAFPNFFLPNNYVRTMQQPLPSWANISSSDTDFLSKLVKTYRYTKITKTTITPDDGSSNVEALIIRHEPSIHFNPAKDKNFIEDYCLLVFSQLVHQKLLAQSAANTAADPALPTLLTVASSTVKHDAAHDQYYEELVLESTGFATASGGKTTLVATSLEKVYGVWRIFSAADYLPYPDDDLFRPVTTFSTPNVPDYAVGFYLSESYTGTDFAFDQCEGFTYLLPRDTVDQNLFTSRYERLFEYNKTKSSFYLVPWMGIPYVKSGSGNYLLEENLFVLKAETCQSTREFATSGNTIRSLKLVPSSSGVHATWASSQTDTLNNVNLMGSLDAIHILVDDGPYNDLGEHIEIVDTADGKVVGKLRIIFLEKRKLNIFLVKVTEENDRFKFQSIVGADIPTSLESLGAATNYAHEKITDDANTFGFKQIGVELNLLNDIVDIYDTQGHKMALKSTSPPLEILKAHIGIKDSEIGESSISSTLQYKKVCDNFLSTIGHLEAGSEKRSKYSAVFVFLTPFHVTDKKMYVVGVCYPNEGGHIGGSPTKNTVKLLTLLGHNVSLFETLAGVPLPAGNWKADWTLGGRYHEYQTLAHELAHALFVNHYFDKPRTDPYSAIVKANQMLRLYLFDEYVSDMVASFDEKKISINDFRTGKVINKQAHTVFDEIIEFGMDQAMENLINKIFPGNSRPGFWKAPSTNDMPLADLPIWISLNDLVKFNAENLTTNVMDYEKTKYGHNPTPVPGKATAEYEAYIVPTAVRFSRFQWELIRKAIRHLNTLTV